MSWARDMFISCNTPKLTVKPISAGLVLGEVVKA